jgi:hypothetical protein
MNKYIDFAAVIELVYNPSKFQYTSPQAESESSEYAASTFELNNREIKFRAAKTTPKKVGQFVTLWKRIKNKPIQPFDMSDKVELFVINVRKGNLLGQFVFPKSILHEKGIISNGNNGGKRAIRVYPPWELNLNQQAYKTQKWQSKYFLEIPKTKPVDLVRAKRLYSSF